MAAGELQTPCEYCAGVYPAMYKMHCKGCMERLRLLSGNPDQVAQERQREIDALIAAGVWAGQEKYKQCT